MKIEAENKELILKSKEGHVAIIPVTHRKQALKHLEEGNDKALNKLIQGLPLMSDYAEDGTLVSNTVSPIDPPVTKKKEYTYDNVKGFKPNVGLAPSDYGFGDLQTLQSTVDDWETNPQRFKPSKGLENETYFRYVAPGNAPNFATHGCTGSSCRAQKQFNPDLPTPYDVLNRQGLNSMITKGEGEENGLPKSPGIDAWEIADEAEKRGVSKKLFAANLNSQEDVQGYKKRTNYIDKFDYSTLPLNTILSFGEARGEYVDTDANWKEGKENMPLPRHTGTLVKFDEETGDAFVYNPGYRNVTNKKGKTRTTKGTASIIRLGTSPEADYDWPTFAKEHNLVYASAINDAGNWTHGKLKQYKKDRTEGSEAAKASLLESKKLTEIPSDKKKKLSL
jgi:hypothetical protein